MKKELTAWRIAALLLLATAWVIGIKQLREPDLWWQLRTGEWILSHGRVMAKDIFSYTFQGTSWINVKWGFEVIIALFSKIGGPEFVMLFQSVINLLILYFLWKVYQLFKKYIFIENDVLRDAAMFIAAFVVLAACEYRMNGRPEMVSHLFTVIFLFFLMRYRFSPGRFIYYLIPLQVLWTNLHEAYGTGMVMVSAFTGAELLYLLLLEKHSLRLLWQQHRALLITLAGCLLAPALHPYGVRMILHPYEIFSQVGENKFTTELFGWQTRLYWQKEAWIALAVLLISVPAFFYQPLYADKAGKKKKGLPVWKRPFVTFGPGYLLLYILFFYLASTAYRNIPFLILVAAPLIAFSLRRFGRRVRLSSNVAAYLLVLTGVATYILIVSNVWYKLADDDRYRYGLRVDEFQNPIGTASYIRENNLKGNEFSDFLVSNYLLWKLSPDFKTFIDLRDLDVFPAGFFRNFGYLDYYPGSVMELDSQYNFNYAVLYRAGFIPLHEYFFNSPVWTPVYADPVGAIYLRNNSANKSLMAKAPAGKDIFHDPEVVKPSGISRMVSYLFNPFWKPVIKPNIPITLIAADYYTSVSQYELAMKKAKEALEIPGAKAMAWQYMGDIHLQLAMKDSIPSRSDSLVRLANLEYQNAIGLDKHLAKGFYGLGRTAMMRQDYPGALAYFKKATQYDPALENAWLGMAESAGAILRNSGNSDKLFNQRIEYLNNALSLDPTNLKLQFYLGVSYGQSGDCDKALEFLEKAPSYPGARKEDVELARNIIIRCGGKP
jgi:tetratricopeptide (TPR) repeat protein